eukprot:scaffold251550_cov32-Tisochrysis_lutea.AAC.1
MRRSYMVTWRPSCQTCRWIGSMTPSSSYMAVVESRAYCGMLSSADIPIDATNATRMRDESGCSLGKYPSKQHGHMIARIRIS